MAEDTYALVARAIRYIEREAQRQPALDVVAAEIGYSPQHLQRVFRRWAGISPKRFLQYVTAEHARALLASNTVSDATYQSGLSSPGRLHDLLVTLHAVTPGEARRAGAGVEVRYRFHATPFGRALFAATQRGLCWLGFVGGDGEEAQLASLQAAWPQATLREGDGRLIATAERVFAPAAGSAALPLHVRGTNFQVQVWQALLRIPPGAAVSYEEVARWCGRPGASRAVGNAIGRNPVAFVIPCHRVLRKSGQIGGYRWGPQRKRLMLAWEAAHRDGAMPRSP